MNRNGRQRYDLILHHAHGEISDAAIREHLRERDARLDLEYDVAWANQFLLRHLLAVFPGQSSSC